MTISQRFTLLLIFKLFSDLLSSQQFPVPERVTVSGLYLLAALNIDYHIDL
jgi:hypothetical protein